jgi:hypothetical protein
MEKRKAPRCRKSCASQNQNSIATIIACDLRIGNLQHFIRKQQLTNALQLLENFGISGDLAIFVLSSLQISEVGGDA